MLPSAFSLSSRTLCAQVVARTCSATACPHPARHCRLARAWARAQGVVCFNALAHPVCCNVCAATCRPCTVFTHQRPRIASPFHALIIGPPGGGKGTISKRIIKQFGPTVLSTYCPPSPWRLAACGQARACDVLRSTVCGMLITPATHARTHLTQALAT